jgi:hypothetical protein
MKNSQFCLLGSFIFGANHVSLTVGVWLQGLLLVAAVISLGIEFYITYREGR